MADKFTTVYVSIPKEDDNFITNYQSERIKQDKRIYKKNEIVKHILDLGMDVIKGKYLKLETKMDSFVSQLQKIKIEKGGQTFEYEKSKEQVYYWLIEKGLEHLDE